MGVCGLADTHHMFLGAHALRTSTAGQPFMSDFHGREPWTKPAAIPPFVLDRIGVNGIKPEEVNGWFTVPLESYESIACAPL